MFTFDKVDWHKQWAPTTTKDTNSKELRHEARIRLVQMCAKSYRLWQTNWKISIRICSRLI
jgi:hypothetical protein